jgi:hypothetical protein
MVDKLLIEDQIRRIRQLEKIDRNNEMEEIFSKEKKLVTSYESYCNSSKLKTNYFKSDYTTGLPKYQIDEIEKLDLKSKIMYFVDYNKLYDLLKNEYYINYILEKTSCIFSNIMKDKYLIQNLLNIEFIDTQEEYKSTVIIFNIKNSETKFVAKWDDKYSITHEAAVTLFVSNEMRKVLPTFVWCYGLTTCNLPLITKNNKIVTSCNVQVKLESNNYIGLLTEYVEGISLLSYLKSDEVNGEDLMKIVLIVICSIFKAFCKFKFVHYDLHPENIRLRKTNGKYKYIKFQKEFYIELPNGIYVPTLIDLGNSLFEKDNYKYGNVQYTQYDRNNQNIFVDCIKLLYTIYVYNKDERVDNVIENVLSSLVSDFDKFQNYLIENFALIFDAKRLIKTCSPKDFINILNYHMEKNGFYLIKNNVDNNLVIPCTINKKQGGDPFSRTDIYDLIELESVLNDIDYFKIYNIDKYFNSILSKSSERIDETAFSNITEAILYTVIIKDELKNMEVINSLLNKYIKIIKDRYKGMDNINLYLDRSNDYQKMISQKIKKYVTLYNSIYEKSNISDKENMIKNNTINKKYGHYPLKINPKLVNETDKIINQEFSTLSNINKKYKKYF